MQELSDDGFSLEELREAAREQRLGLLPVDRVLNREGSQYTSAEIAERTGLPLDVLRNLWRALGLAVADEGSVVYSEADLKAATTVGQFHAAGLPEDSLVRISQVLGHSMSALAETLREVAGQALLKAGDTERKLGLRYASATEHLVPLLTPMLGYILAVHLREQVKTDIISQAELDTGRLEGSREVTVGFADLVGFTRFGERVQPVEVGTAGRRLTEMAVEVARPPVRLVKMIGDAAMLVSPDPEALVSAALGLLVHAETGSNEMPSVRVGIANGHAISQSGDWFGSPVNLASRITDVAWPSSVLVAKPVRDAVKPSFAWSYAGTERFKGVKGEVPLYRARSLTADAA